MFIFILFLVISCFQVTSPTFALGRHDVDDSVFVEQAKPFKAVGQLYFSSSEKDISTGTGTLVEHHGMQFVLTTGHMPLKAKLKEIEFEGKRYRIERYIPLKDVIFKDVPEMEQLQLIIRKSGMDIGMAFLQEYPTDIKPLPLGASIDVNSLPNKEYAFVGYGVKSLDFWRGLMLIQDEKRRLFTTKIAFTPFRELLSSKLASKVTNPYLGTLSAVFKEPTDKNVTPYEGCVAPGYSGGPLIVKDQKSGHMEVIGVVASHTSNTKVSCYMAYAGIDYYHYGHESYYSPVISTLPFIEIIIAYEKYHQQSLTYMRILKPDDQYLEFVKEDRYIRKTFDQTLKEMGKTFYFSYDRLKNESKKFQEKVEHLIKKFVKSN